MHGSTSSTLSRLLANSSPVARDFYRSSNRCFYSFQPLGKLMTVRTISVLCVCFAATLCVNVAADEATSKDDATWITVVQAPNAHADRSQFVIQVTSGAEFRLVDAIAETLPNMDDGEIRLLPASKVNLTFVTDSFLVMKLQGKSLTLAPGTTFPFSLTRKLAKSMSKIGFSETKIESPEKLLVRRTVEDPFARSFAFRDGDASNSRLEPSLR